MKKKIISAILFLSLSCFLFSCAHKENSWAYDKMVTWNGNVYVASNRETDKVASKLGSVKYYSTEENGSGKDSFSNYYKVGTVFYSIPNIDTKDSIAIEIPSHQYTILVNEKSLHGQSSSL